MKLISEIKPSIMLNCSISEAMDKIMNAISSDEQVNNLSRDDANQEIRGVWNLKSNKAFGGEGMLVRYSFVESEAGNTVVTATGYRENGKQDFIEIFGMYEKIMRRPFEKL